MSLPYSWVILVAFAGTLGIARAGEVSRYEGLARDAEDGQLLYRETHYLQQGADRLQQRLVLYHCPHSKAAFARKRVRYGEPAQQPEFELVDARLGYREGLRRDGVHSRTTFVQPRRDAPEEQAALPLAGFVADAGFDEFLKQHWEALLDDAELRLDFLVPAELGTIAFKIRKHREERVAGRDAVVIRLSLGAWWGFIAPHIDAAYDRQTRALLRYQGLSNLRDADGRNLNVRIDFPPDQAEPSDLAALRAARRQPLVESCPAATNVPRTASP